jgi:predicted nucleic acid-binding protein
MYVAGKDHPNKEPSRRFLEKVHSGELEGCTSTEVLQEILYRFVALERRKMAFEVYDLFAQICPKVLPVNIADTDRARIILEESNEVSVRDAIHAAVMINNGIEQIASFDKGFDGIEGVERIELG